MRGFKSQILNPWPASTQCSSAARSFEDSNDFIARTKGNKEILESCKAKTAALPGSFVLIRIWPHLCASGILFTRRPVTPSKSCKCTPESQQNEAAARKKRTYCIYRVEASAYQKKRPFQCHRLNSRTEGFPQNSHVYFHLH